MIGLRPLRAHQETAMAGLRESLRSGHRRPMLSLPTGSGKTVIAAHIVQGALAKGNRLAFVVPLLSLIDQTFERFCENGIDPGDMGVIQGDHDWRRPHAPVQICSVQTLARRGMPIASVFVVDEAHIRNQQLHTYLASEEAKGIVAIGLSATPWAKGLGRVYDDLIRPITMAELIAQGYLSPFKVFAPSHPDLADVKIDSKTGDYQTGGLSDVMSEPKLVADIVTTWLEKGENRPTLCFAVDRAHAASIHEQFEKSGVASAYVDANTPRDERAVLAKRFAAGDIKVICNIGTMTTGVDLDIRCVIFARPTKSESLFVQCIGRGLRTAPGKDYCLILDHSDTHLRLGMVTDIGREQLCHAKPGAGDSGRETAVRMPKECSACAALVPVGAPECPHCGFVPERVSNVICEEGELVELGSKGSKKPKGDSAKVHLMRMGREAIFQQIKYMAEERGWSHGRAGHVYRDIFDVFPRGLDSLPPMEPCVELRSWIRHRDLAWAKSKKREASRAA